MNYDVEERSLSGGFCIDVFQDSKKTKIEVLYRSKFVIFKFVAVEISVKGKNRGVRIIFEMGGVLNGSEVVAGVCLVHI